MNAAHNLIYGRPCVPRGLPGNAVVVVVVVTGGSRRARLSRGVVSISGGCCWLRFTARRARVGG